MLTLCNGSKFTKPVVGKFFLNAGIKKEIFFKLETTCIDVILFSYLAS